MSDVGPYGYHQHSSDQITTANQMVGSPVGSTIGDAVTEGAGPAFLSTAPYRPRHPKTRAFARKGMCKGMDDTCSRRAKFGDYCGMHK